MIPLSLWRDARLRAAAARGGAAQVQALLDRGADPNARSLLRGATALMRAAGHVDGQVLAALIQRGAAVDAADRLGATALHYAVEGGHAGSVQALIAAGATVHGWKAEPLWVAAQRGHLEIVRILLASDANAETAVLGNTALWAAVANRHFQIAQALLNAGADPLARRSAYATRPLDAARDPQMRTLLETARDIRESFGRGDEVLAARTLPEALRYELSPLVSRLLCDAAEAGNPRMVAATIDACRSEAEPVVEVGGLLRGVVARGHLDLTIRFLGQGVDPNARDERGRTVLMVALDERRSSLVEPLLLHGADPNAMDAEGRTPLEIARGIGSKAVLQALIDGGARLPHSLPAR